MSKVKTDTRVWDQLKKRLQANPGIHVQVGVISDKGGNEDVGGGFTLTELAAVHEYGSPANNIPERSFIRRTFDDKQDEQEKLSAKLAKQVVENKTTLEKAHEVLGQWGSTEVKKTITEHRVEPKTDKIGTTLVESGRLLNSITYKVTTDES